MLLILKNVEIAVLVAYSCSYWKFMNEAKLFNCFICEVLIFQTMLVSCLAALFVDTENCKYLRCMVVFRSARVTSKM
jgi:hypothetical protein